MIQSHYALSMKLQTIRGQQGHGGILLVRSDCKRNIVEIKATLHEQNCNDRREHSSMAFTVD